MYRGRGLKQITFKANYQSITKYYAEIWDKIDFVEQPDLLSSDIKYATRSALAFWTIEQLYNLADKGINKESSYAITKIVNRGTPKKIRYEHLIRFYHEEIFKDVFKPD